MTIFVAGIHGVGKTYLCEKYVKDKDVVHASASKLIREELASANWNSNKQVADIDKNQEALISAVERHHASGKVLLLDGHFVLKDSSGKLIQIEIEVFRDLRLHGVILIEADVELVQERIKLRDNVLPLGDLAAFSRAERMQAELVCTSLNIPLRILSSPTEKEFSQTIEEF